MVLVLVLVPLSVTRQDSTEGAEGAEAKFGCQPQTLEGEEGGGKGGSRGGGTPPLLLRRTAGPTRHWAPEHNSMCTNNGLNQWLFLGKSVNTTFCHYGRTGHPTTGTGHGQSYPTRGGGGGGLVRARFGISEICCGENSAPILKEH